MRKTEKLRRNFSVKNISLSQKVKRISDRDDALRIQLEYSVRGF